MGRQSSRIIWGHTEKDPDDKEKKLVPVMEMQTDIIYVSGNIVIYPSSSGKIGIYQCIVEESCNNAPDVYIEDWKELPSEPLFIIKHVPGAPSKVDEILNSRRTNYKPGARVIVRDPDDLHYYAYMCTKPTNVYYDGFNKNYWGKIYQTVGVTLIPKDHKDVYYNGKYHMGMYYMPSDPQEAEDEIYRFKDDTAYAKGEMVLYKARGDYDQRENPLDPTSPIVYEAPLNTVYEYTFGIPSTPTQKNPKTGAISYQQPTPQESGHWDVVDIPVWTEERSYNKGDLVVYDYFADEEGQTAGWYYTYVTVFSEGIRYKRGQRCLYRIKPVEGDSISEKDCLKLKETGDYDMLPMEPPYWMEEVPKPTSEYGKLIESDAEIYGLYEYIGSDYKPVGEDFINSQWQLIPEVRMFNEDIAKYRTGYTAGELVIGMFHGSYSLFRVMRDREPDYYITMEMYRKYGLDAMCYGYFIGELWMSTYWIGFPAAPSDVENDPRVEEVWSPVTQLIKDEARGTRVYKAVKDIPYGMRFSLDNFTVVTQNKKMFPDYYGWIWKKFNDGGGGNPFSSDFPIITTNFSSQRFLARFNSLTLYRGDNRLNVGSVITTTRDNLMNDFQIEVVGSTGWYHHNIVGNTTPDKIFIRDTFSPTWYIYDMKEILLFYGIQVAGTILRDLRFWQFGIITFYINRRDEGVIYHDVYKLTLLNYSEKQHLLVLLKTISDISSYDGFNNDTILKGKTNSFLYDFVGRNRLPSITNQLDQGLLYVPDIDWSPEYCGMAFGSRELVLVYNEEGNIIYTYFQDGSWSSQGRVAHLSDFCEPYDTIIQYLRSFLTFDITTVLPETDVYYRGLFAVSYYHFTDGYVGDIDTPDTMTYANNFTLRYEEALENAGAIGVYRTTTEEPWSEEIYGHHADKMITYGLSYRIHEPYYVLLPGTEAEHQFPVYGDNSKWITMPPLIGHYMFYNCDKSALYNLRWFYGYFSRFYTYIEEQKLTLGYYSLVILDKTIVNTGRTTSSVLINSWSPDVGIYIEDPSYSSGGNWSTHTALTTDFIVSSRISNNMVYSERFTPVFYDDHYLYVINSSFDEETNKIIGSTGLHVFSFNAYKPSAQTITVSNHFFYPIVIYNDYVQALYQLCIIEKIPYYGYQTATLKGMNRTIKYLSLNIADLSFNTSNEYLTEKYNEINSGSNILISCDLTKYQNPAITNRSAGSLVNNPNDIIITMPIQLQSGDGTLTKRYILCVVLPKFKVIFPNCMNYISQGLGCYNPVMSGAFFWLTSDDIVYNVEPQYGGPESGAQGFSGW